MITKKTTKPQHSYGDFIGRLYSFNTSLKLYHWDVTGIGSYAKHMALDQALDSLYDTTDSIAECTIALHGTLGTVVPKTVVPTDLESHIEEHYDYVDTCRDMYADIFMQSIIDDYQQALQQLLYRLKRLK